ncbi:hypothetical protein MLD38_007299 [Melastoma candidum]|uniref:Uncharacterized protein n=1 Tax=Melastoma candidum TaxID=119954 RepID=A0ACB9RTP4_9MYRT|nr:hypothetical protein MLD38_007299 [Melastoma candidum]
MYILSKRLICLCNCSQELSKQASKFREGCIYHSLIHGRHCCPSLVGCDPNILQLHLDRSLHERLNRSLTVCQDKLEAGKLQAAQSDLLKDFESCIERTIDEHIKLLPHLKKRLKSSLGMIDY